MRTLCIILAFLSLHPQAFGQLDLHAHLDMKPGMGVLISGGFNDAPHASQWASRLRTKASSLSLNPLHSPKLVVVSFYAHPYFSRLFHFDLRENVQLALDQEYSDLLTFVQTHAQDWVIAKTPADARSALNAGKHVFVLSIEGADNGLEEENDFKKWIDERGVAIVTPFHLTEDHLGGAAFIPNRLAWLNSPINFIESVMLTGGSCLFGFCKSPVGMKPDGDLLIRNLWKRRVWIDLAHANEMEVRELIPQLAAKKLPLLVTHTEIREVYPAERGVGSLEATYVTEHEGMIGLLPSEDMMPREIIVPGQEAVDPACRSGLTDFKKVFQYARKQLGEMNIALGSDVNSPINGLSPLCKLMPGQNPSELEQKGYYTYSQWNELSEYVSESPDWNTKIVDRFLELWDHARANSR